MDTPSESQASQPKTRFNNLMVTLLAGLLQLGCLLLAGLTLAGFGGGLHWLLDLTNHFRPVYSLLQPVIAVALLLLGRRGWAGLCSVFWLINLGLLLPFYWPRSQPPVAAEPFRLVQLNVCAPAKDYGRTSAYLRREDPDLIALEECAERCIAHLQRDGVWQRYPHHFRKMPHRHRLVVLSKYPLRELSLALPADPAVALFELKRPQGLVTVFVMHSTRPSSGGPYHRHQIKQFERIAALAKASEQPFVMLGDLNTTPWGYSLRRLLADSGLRNSMDGFGIQPSFPVFVPRYPQWLTPPLFPIDQILISRHFQVLERRSGPVLDSDHLPVSVDLSL